MYFQQDRNELRQTYFDVWRRRADKARLEPMELLILGVMEEHPEYHGFLDDPDASLDRDFSPEYGQSNPFLHMGMHIAIREQLTTDRPPGFAEAYAAVVRQCGDSHEAEHRILECLAETLWRAHRDGASPDELDYLDKVRTLGG
jgi:hypothetical protein